MLRLALCFSLVVAFLPGRAVSAVLTLREAIAKAEAYSPDLKVSEADVESMEARARQALAPSEPSLTLIYNDTTEALHLSRAASVVYQLTQPIGFPGKAFISRSSLRSRARSLSEQAWAKRLAVATAVRTAYYNLALAKKNLELNLDQKRSYERILEIAKQRYQSGSIPRVDLIATQSALYNNLNDLAELQANEHTVRAQLNLLLGNEPEAPLEVAPLKPVTPRKIDPEKLEERLTRSAPDVQSAVYRRKSADDAYTLASLSLLPDFQLYVGTTYYPAVSASPYSGASNLQHTYLAGIQLTVPLWGFFNERETIRAAAHERAAAEAQLDSRLLQARTDLQTRLATLQAIELKLANYRDHLLPLADQALSLALEGYRQGKINLARLTELTSAWRGTQTAYFSTIVTYLTSWSALSQLTGEALDDEAG